ncbi:MAG: hypothetical protein M3Z14_03605 [Candidatus Eremiobacteraeota bacterium]|nr:hypothetical protein [Candidatus Eremiobacteraeota bacterium]
MTTGILIVLAFGVFAALMYTRVMPAILALPLMAMSMAALAGVSAIGIGAVVKDGAVALASVYVTVIFGAMLGRVTMETGIAEAIVNFAAEFGGDRPALLALVLSAAVALLFISLSGLGAIIMVGSIVLPIMMTVGVPRKVAAILFLLAFALGFIFNIVQWTFYIKYFGVTRQAMQEFALVLALIDLVALLTFALIAFRTTRNYATWAVASADPPAKRAVAWFALITPILPLVLFFRWGLDPIVAFTIAAVYGVLTTRPTRAIATLIACAIRGLEDVAPAILLMIGIGMLLAATKTPEVGAALKPLLTLNALRNPLVYVGVFGLLSPLVLYRGPLNPLGVGIAVFTVLFTGHVLPPVILVAAIMAVVQVQNVCDPTNTANVWVANFTGVAVNDITRRALAYQVAVATVACIIVIVFSRSLFGVAPFSALGRAAQAGETLPGMYPPESAAESIAVGTDGSPDAARAADAVMRDINGGWHDFHAMLSQEDPNARDCSAKPYAAFLRVNSTRFKLEAGTDVDVGLVLSDCAGWGVDEWHDHQVFAYEPSADEIQRLAISALLRMRVWTRERPRVASNLFTHGLAFDPSRDRPTYFYSLFKTVDGYMRAMVRPGGPAYVAGMRTNDIVDKLDGKFWWEYGTFQTQLRAYDGKPHTFELTRGTQAVFVRLGAPFQ